MRKYIIAGMLLLSGGSSHLYAQWTTSGSNIYNNNSGNVGIGIATPTTRLAILANANDDLISFNSSSSTNAYIGTAVLQGQMIPGSNSKDLIIRSESQKIMFSANAGTSAHMVIGVNGDIGIGTSIPQGKLDVRGNAIFGTSKLLYLNPDFAGNGEIPSGTFIGSNGSNSLALVPSSNAGTVGAKIVLNYRSSSWFSALEVANVASGYSNLLLMKSGGNVGIGTTSPAAKLDVNGSIYSNGKIFIGISDANTATKIAPYALAVNGSAIFTKAVVKSNAAWPDYVFAAGYKMPQLDSLEQFIKINKHLPEIPKAETVEKDGIDLGNNQALLLKKIEELTLIAIEQNKQTANLQKIVEAQNMQTQTLRQIIEDQNKKIKELEANFKKPL